MEISRENFTDQLDNISKDLKQSCFVGFDAEFTAILSNERFKYRLFDTNEERYDRIKGEVSNMIMTQIGLTMFRYDNNLDTYIATGYTFHLCPQVFGNIDQSFIFQASTLKFLCRHKFDFNKFTYEGLPYLSKAEEKSVRQHLHERTLFHNMTRNLEWEEEKQVQKYCSEVSKWLTSPDEDTMYLDVESPTLRHKNVEGATSASMEILDENLMKHLLGFSHIISMLETSQKPIIGHNIFLDLVLLHNQFIGPLPQKYCDFKKNIHGMFPCIFDTKYISHEMSRKLSFDDVWKSNSLQDLYEFFAEKKCRKLPGELSSIKISTPFNVKQSYHEAGWDSYCSGYCFIRLGHWAACETLGKYRPVRPPAKLTALAPLCNRVNVIRGAVPYMNVAAADPPPHRPPWLHVRALRARALDVDKVASLLASFGSIDIKPHGTRTALIAASSQYSVDKILTGFKKNNDYKISVYKVNRRTAAGRLAIWSGALLTGSIVLLFLHQKMNGKS